MNVISAIQPKIYIGPEETTTRRYVLEKVAIFGILLGSGLFLASYFITGLAIAVLSGLAYYYLSRIDSPNSSDEYPLIQAVKKGNQCLVKWLLLLGANPNVFSQNSALKNGAAFGHTQIVKDLLAANADPNIKDQAQATPLMEAIEMTQDDIVEALLESGADSNLGSGRIYPAVNCVHFAYKERKRRIEHPDSDIHILGDKRSKIQRSEAAHRILELLDPFVAPFDC